MPNIDDILNDLGVQEDTNSLEKTAQLVSNSDSEQTKPQLQNYYEQHWEPAGSQEKTASYQENTMQNLDMEKVGSVARDYFQDIMEERLDYFAMLKQAEENNMPDSAASMKAQGFPNVIPGPVANPQLEVNNPQTDDGIDTAPEYYSLQEKNKAADKLQNALSDAQLGTVAGGELAQADDVKADQEKTAALKYLVNTLY
ncbi:MAG: hypothetical protein DRQ88_13325 [Epsilonproteobacteria bacterium]|nr:MAG: hypothetical protein DRQ88_13325 [Campylobacterota bacterium]